MSLKNQGRSPHKNFTTPPAASLFAEGLLRWNREENDRSMPWKGEKDPYRIWLSEVILQQTRVAQGLKYYENFIKAFPDVQALATAPEAQVFKLWEGLGYYSRCRNLIAAARSIAAGGEGVFPRTYEEILALKGVGPYTAAAIASFAYNLPHAVLDGNVYRVLARIFAIDTPVDSTEGKKRFAALAQSLLPEGRAGEYNQAIMDFGALICKPQPLCDRCFFQDRCAAFAQGRQDLLPVKGAKASPRERWFTYFLIRCGDEIAVRQRTGRDIWQQLYEFVLIETPEPLPDDTLLHLLEEQYGLGGYRLQEASGSVQKLSHQTIHFRLLQLSLDHKQPIPGYFWVPGQKLDQYAFPRTLAGWIPARES